MTAGHALQLLARMKKVPVQENLESETAEAVGLVMWCCSRDICKRALSELAMRTTHATHHRLASCSRVRALNGSRNW